MKGSKAKLKIYFYNERLLNHKMKSNYGLINENLHTLLIHLFYLYNMHAKIDIVFGYSLKDYSCKRISLFRNWSMDYRSDFIAFRRDALEWKIFQ